MGKLTALEKMCRKLMITQKYCDYRIIVNSRIIEIKLSHSFLKADETETVWVFDNDKDGKRSSFVAIEMECYKHIPNFHPLD